MVTIDPSVERQLSRLSASLDLMYEETNDATMLDLPEDLVEAMDNAKGAVDECMRAVQDFLRSSERKELTGKVAD